MTSSSSVLLAGENPTELLNIIGFGDIWDDGGGAGFSRWLAAWAVVYPPAARLKESYIWSVRFALLCASPESCPADAAARLPSPSELVEMERQPSFQSSLYGPLWPGARALLKLGEVDKAVEVAKAGVEESKNALTRIGCHQVLAEAAHGRQNTGEAEREFQASSGLHTRKPGHAGGGTCPFCVRGT